VLCLFIGECKMAVCSCCFSNVHECVVHCVLSIDVLFILL